MISKVAHRFAGRDLVVGDEFEADEKYVQVLIALGRARVKRRSGAYQTRVMTAGEANIPVVMKSTRRKRQGRS
jgi:hypothetical protein